MEHTPAWLLHTFIYLSAAVIAVPLSQFLGLGSIIGYLGAGMVIGPWGLGLVTQVEDILHFAEFGVVLMLFLVGLELEPERLWKLRRPIFGWGSVQVLMCALLITGGATLFGLSWRVALVCGLGLALSSTAIALQVMKERNLLATSSGQASFAILLFQDVAAIPILALLPLLAVNSDTNLAEAPIHHAQEAIKIIALCIPYEISAAGLALSVVPSAGCGTQCAAAGLGLVLAGCGIRRGYPKPVQPAANTGLGPHGAGLGVSYRDERGG